METLAATMHDVAHKQPVLHVNLVTAYYLVCNIRNNDTKLNCGYHEDIVMFIW